MLWLLLLFSAQVVPPVTQADLSGTWKVREPAVFETAFEICELRSVVAYVTHTGNDITGSYEALVSCNDPHWPDDEWRKRVGTVTGTVDGDAVSLAIDDLVVLQGSTVGDVMTGTVQSADGAPEWAWAAAKVRH